MKIKEAKENIIKNFRANYTNDHMSSHYKDARAEGMSLRDYFAAKALQGFIANGVDHYDGQGDSERYAKMSYKYANAMLKEREEQERLDTIERHPEPKSI